MTTCSHSLPPRAPRVRALSIAAALSALALSSPAAAQRARTRREPPPPPPALLSLSPLPEGGDVPPEPFRRVLTLRATSSADVVADRRLLRLEVRAPGARRALQCEHPDRPRRAPRDRVVHLEAGQAHEEWIDLREYCWGRALDALRAGDAEITAHYGPRRPRRGDFVARTAGEPAVLHAALAPIALSFPAAPAPGEPEGGPPVRVLLSDRDARSGRAITLSVRVRARGEGFRAYARPDRFRFLVHGPEGDFVCAVRPGGGAIPPDLFRRVTARSGPAFALDASYYCPDDAFRAAGVYEVVPELELHESGARWGWDTPTGTFRGAPALVRVRRDARGYVERPVREERAARGDDS